MNKMELMRKIEELNNSLYGLDRMCEYSTDKKYLNNLKQKSEADLKRIINFKENKLKNISNINIKEENNEEPKEEKQERTLLQNYLERGIKTYDKLFESIDLKIDELKNVNKGRRVRKLDNIEMLKRGILYTFIDYKDKSEDLEIIFEVNYSLPAKYYMNNDNTENATKAIIKIDKNSIDILKYERSSAISFNGTEREWDEPDE